MGGDALDLTKYHVNAMTQYQDTPSMTHPAAILAQFASPLGFTPRGIQLAMRISKLIKPEDQNVAHKEWHGQTPNTLAAVTLYIAMHMGDRVRAP